MDNAKKARVVLATVIVCMVLAFLAPLSWAVTASANTGYGLTVDVVDFDGTPTGEPLTWDMTTAPVVWDPSAATLKREVQAARLLKVTNTGSYDWNTFWVNLTSSDPALDLMEPGTWYVITGDLDTFTNTTTVNVTYNHGQEVVQGVIDRFTYDDNPNNDNAIPALEKVVAKVKDNGGGNHEVEKHNDPPKGKPNKSPVAFNHTLAPGASMYVQFVMTLDNLPPQGTYAVDWTLRAFDSWDSMVELQGWPSTRAIGSDTETGGSTLGVGEVLDFAISYTGTHTTEVYFTQFVGAASTVPATNNMRITNVGNVDIDSLAFDVGTSQFWMEDTDGDGVGDVATAYQLNGNTEVRRSGFVGWSPLDPAHTYTYFPGIPPTVGNFRDFEFRLLNAALSEGDFWATVEVTASDGVTTLTKTGSLEYQTYTGTLDVSLTYTSGTTLAFPTNTLPGDTNVATTNAGRITNLGTSDFDVDTLVFLFGPLTQGTESIGFGDNANLILDDGTTSFTYPLVSFTQGTDTFGRSLVELGTAGTPALLAPTSFIDFSVTLYTIPTVTPGSYSGQFTVEAAANPVQVLYGSYSLGSENLTGLAPYATPSPATVGQPQELGAWVNWTRGGEPWPYLSFKVRNASGVLVWGKEVTITERIADALAEDLNATNLSIKAVAGNWTPEKAGNYTLTVTQGVFNGTALGDIGLTRHLNLTVREAIGGGGVLTGLWDRLVGWSTENGWGLLPLVAGGGLVSGVGIREWRKRRRRSG